MGSAPGHERPAETGSHADPRDAACSPSAGDDRATPRLAEFGDPIGWASSAGAPVPDDSLYALAIEGANDGLWDWDAETGRVFRSRRTQEIIGMYPADMLTIGDQWLRLIHPDDVKRYKSTVRALLKSGANHYSCEYRIRHVDGSYRWLLDRAMARRGASGRAYRMAGSVTDITERKRAEQALRESNQRFRDYANTASDWYWETDEQHRFPNRLAVDLPGGFEAVQWCGKHRWDFAIDLETDSARWHEHFERLERREPFRDFTYKVARMDGTVQVFSVSGKPVYDAEGRWVGYRGSGRDVTASVLAADDLRRAKREAEAANAAKSEFLANMSHELRTPLNAILGFSEVIAQEMLGPAGVARYREYADDIHRSGRHLLRLINDILDMSKIEAGKFELREQFIDVERTILNCLPLVRQRAIKAGISIETHVPADLPTLCADETRLQQILLNLLTNAIKFTPRAGQVTLSVEHEAAGSLAIAVRDTGIGMSPEEIARALEPFRQVESALSKRLEGTGLGLPLAKRLVELHGGEMTVDSTPTVGTTVALRFPVDRVLVRPAEIRDAG